MKKTIGVTILVLEDEKPLLQAIKTKLEKSGFDVVTARRANQAISYLNDLEKIDIIWMDHYLLGRENGLDFVTELKGDEKWKKIPIFVVSNTASPDKVQSYIKLGVKKYYTKSDFRLDEIIGDIKKTLEKPEGLIQKSE